MACYHFHLDQISRGKGKLAVAAAAYRSGTRLANSYYGEISDYTKKGGVLLSEIHLPPHAPERFADRETLWNEVEWTEKNGRAQLANNFEIALMNEFTMEENIGLARRFVEEQLVARGMTADLCIHDPGRKEGQPPNPHMHILTPIRPLKEDGTWGPKEKKVPVLDADGSPVTGKNGNPKYRAVSTTGWTSKETLEELRKAWADLCNEMYQKKGLSISVDHRSYEARGIDQIPTVHEGARVRAMEEKGIRTMLGDLNRMIRKLNRMLKKAKEALAVIGDAKETIIEAMKEKEAPTLENGAKLLILDPIQAYLGADVDMNRANEIRPIFRSLAGVAERTGCAIVLIGHLNKNAGQQSNYRGLGSIDIAAAVRSILYVAKVENEKDEDVRVVIQTKDSLAPAMTPVAFSLDEEGPRFLGRYEITMEELLSGKKGVKTESKIEQAMMLIRNKLADGRQMFLKELEAEAGRLGISSRTMRDARSRMAGELEYGSINRNKIIKLKEKTAEKTS